MGSAAYLDEEFLLYVLTCVWTDPNSSNVKGSNTAGDILIFAEASLVDSLQSKLAV